MSASQAPPQQQISSTRVMMYAMLAMPAVFAVLVLLSIDEWGELPFWMIAVVVGSSVIALVGCEMFGYNPTPIAPGTRRETAERQAVEAWRTSSIIRITLAEAIVLLGVVFAYVESSLAPMTLGLALGWPLMAWEALTTGRAVEKLTAKLERNGGQAHLAGLFGLPDRRIR